MGLARDLADRIQACADDEGDNAGNDAAIAACRVEAKDRFLSLVTDKAGIDDTKRRRRLSKRSSERGSKRQTRDAYKSAGTDKKKGREAGEKLALEQRRASRDKPARALAAQDESTDLKAALAQGRGDDLVDEIRSRRRRGEPGTTLKERIKAAYAEEGQSDKNSAELTAVAISRARRFIRRACRRNNCTKEQCRERVKNTMPRLYDKDGKLKGKKVTVSLQLNVNSGTVDEKKVKDAMKDAAKKHVKNVEESFEGVDVTRIKVSPIKAEPVADGVSRFKIKIVATDVDNAADIQGAMEDTEDAMIADVQSAIAPSGNRRLIEAAALVSGGMAIQIEVSDDGESSLLGDLSNDEKLIIAAVVGVLSFIILYWVCTRVCDCCGDEKSDPDGIDDGKVEPDRNPRSDGFRPEKADNTVKKDVWTGQSSKGRALDIDRDLNQGRRGKPSKVQKSALVEDPGDYDDAYADIEKEHTSPTNRQPARVSHHSNVMDMHRGVELSKIPSFNFDDDDGLGLIKEDDPGALL